MSPGRSGSTRVLELTRFPPSRGGRNTASQYMKANEKIKPTARADTPPVRRADGDTQLSALSRGEMQAAPWLRRPAEPLQRGWSCTQAHSQLGDPGPEQQRRAASATAGHRLCRNETVPERPALLTASLKGRPNSHHPRAIVQWNPGLMHAVDCNSSERRKGLALPRAFGLCVLRMLETAGARARGLWIGGARRGRGL